MIDAPFALLAAIPDIVRVSLLTKDDAISCDADVMRSTGCQRIASSRQVHGAACVVVRAPTSRVIDADALLTDQPGLTLTTRFADCQGFVIVHPVRRLLAVVHAGWKGLCAGVLTRAIERFTIEWDVAPAELLVCAGPSLCRDCAGFTDPVSEAPALAAFVVGRSIDLRAAADAELMAAGIEASKIERIKDCTRCSPDRYWTWRGGDRDRVAQGFTNVLVATLASPA